MAEKKAAASKKETTAENQEPNQTWEKIKSATVTTGAFAGKTAATMGMAYLLGLAYKSGSNRADKSKAAG